MVKKVITNKVGLTSDKKEILKDLMGSSSSEQIDFNKVRDEYKNDAYNTHKSSGLVGKEYKSRWVE